MAESTLSLTLLDFKKAVADYLGFGRDDTKWSANELAQVLEYVKSGLRQFYNPPVLPGRARPHEWTFLRPTTTLAVVADDSDYDLPDGFGGLIGALAFSSEDNIAGTVGIVPLGEILRRRSFPSDVTGPPQIVATRPKTGVGATGQRWELLLWPVPNGSYTLTYRYQIIPDHIGNDGHYPWGGQQHAETILASCLAVAERMDERPENTKRNYFLERLTASIAVDERQVGEFVGRPLGAWSGDGVWGLQSLRQAYLPPVTYGNVLYGGDP